jgi:hypothetical protein
VPQAEGVLRLDNVAPGKLIKKCQVANITAQG